MSEEEIKDMHDGIKWVYDQLSHIQVEYKKEMSRMFQAEIHAMLAVIKDMVLPKENA